jgi:large subunit ribosomal protein L13
MEKTTKISDIKRNWHLIDAKDKVLGRLATQITPLLLGKNKPYFVKNLDCGDFVVVINARYVKVTGRKAEQKTYSSYSGYPAGQRIRKYSQLIEEHPDRIILNAVSGMLPDNKLKSRWLGKLHVFPENEHKFNDKFMSKAKRQDEKVTKETKVTKLKENK